MAENTLALQVRPTEFGNNFSAGFNNGLNQQAAQQQMASAALAEKQKSMQALYMVSAGVLRDGEASPEEWDGVVAMMEQNGADPAFVDKLRGNPEMAKVLAMGSGEALKFSQDERQMDLQMQKLAADIDMAAQDRALKTRQLDQGDAQLEFDKSKPLSVAPGETLVDPQSRKPFFTGPTASATKPPEIVTIFKGGKEQKGYMGAVDEAHPDGFYPVGDTKADEAGDVAANFDDISGIRKEIHQLPSYKNMAQATPIYQSMAETAGRNSRASDLNLVYGLGKIMDPTSVVREGEMVMVKNTASLPDWLIGTINSLNGGQALTPKTRQAILSEAYSRMKAYEDAFSQDAGRYKAIADRYGINPDDILPDFRPASPWSLAEGDDGGGGAKAPAGAGDYDWTEYF